jgi:carotenoid cleavage dioxygenase-like enzyme
VDGPNLHPFARHAVLDRRGFIVRAAVTAAALGPAAALLGCSSGANSTAASGSGSLPSLQYDPTQPYWMQGGFAPVAVESEAVDLSVTGSLPPELTGLYVRNGSNPASGPSPHWFLGDGMVHGVRFEAGRATWYRNRYVDTPLYTSRSGLLGGGGAPGGAANQSNVSVFHHAGRLLSSGEIGLPYEISTADLTTIGPYDFGGALRTAMTAHPKIDPASGKLHFFGYGFVPPYLTYHVASADGVLEHSEEVVVAGPTMIHDFAITDRDVVFWELPVVFDLQAAMKAVAPESSAPGGGLSGDGSQFPFRWDPSYGARVGIMPLGGPASAIRWIEIDPCYVFHGVNAHRVGDDVIVDVCRLPTMFRPGGDPGPNAIHRWTIDTSGPTLAFHDEVLSDEQMDLPSLDRRQTGRAHDNAWFLMVEPRDGFDIEFGGLSRMHTQSGSLDRYAPGAGYRMSEGCFVPTGKGSADGFLLSYAWDRARGASDLVVLDAMDMAAGPIAQVHLPVRVPYGFHGTWVPQTI